MFDLFSICFDGSDMVSGSDEEVSDEISMGALLSLVHLGECLCQPMWKTLC